MYKEMISLYGSIRTLVGALYYSAFTTYLLASHILRWNFSKGLSSNPPGGPQNFFPPPPPG